MEVIKERLEREYSLELITTAPSVSYEILKTNGEEIEVNSPSELPTPNEISEIREPIIKTTILCPDKYVGDIIELAISKRGVQKNLQYLGGQVSIIFDLPLSEIVMDFFDLLKSGLRLDISLYFPKTSSVVMCCILLGLFGNCFNTLLAASITVISSSLPILNNSPFSLSI